VTNSTAGKTYYAKWIELKSDAISMEYGSTQTLPTIEGVTLSNWQSSDSTIVSIEDDQLKANKVGKTTITATARTEAGGTGTLTVNVEVTPMRIIYGKAATTQNVEGLWWGLSCPPEAPPRPTQPQRRMTTASAVRTSPTR